MVHFWQATLLSSYSFTPDSLEVWGSRARHTAAQPFGKRDFCHAFFLFLTSSRPFLAPPTPNFFFSLAVREERVWRVASSSPLPSPKGLQWKGLSAYPFQKKREKKTPKNTPTHTEYYIQTQVTKKKRRRLIAPDSDSTWTIAPNFRGG
ncbi:hypothetical protein ASPZODRAFT_738157 [Penicilliopsis zonata CBS 506.65]|uniref:Uncharacterized protein n=1 Tax=Penicilliopsis zonata CBS 506.65 TaxID=1073090 RepID=A0A1L9SC83_9EURO|nr:hypothetical protein ASPZODRAFT_738157 [Penicilliopsis zonata CBS 506.65]OJJ44776.1 hypothetical protein ASPZODRAFT_738157 [Penicilliopsis zonata CBS 506.65]